MNLIRPNPVDMQPHYNGLFTIEQVAILAAKRGLLTYRVGDLFEAGADRTCEVRHGQAGTPVRIVATQPGLWSPVEIFSKCREALGKSSYVVAHGKIKNDRNLDEVLIASVIGADGINPYLTRKTEHCVCDLEGVEAFWNGPIKELYQEHIRTKYPEFFGKLKVIASPGDWTTPMTFVMCQAKNAGYSTGYRRALYALREAGLIELTTGGRNGIGTATYEWMDLAKIQPPKLATEDADALNAFAA
jgi:hypothetical protein